MSPLLLVMCGRRVEKLGGQDRRWLKVANLLSETHGAKILVNASYARLAKNTEIPFSGSIRVVAESKNKYIAYFWLNLVVFFQALWAKQIHFCGNALEMTPSAVLLWALLRKKITFSFNGVSVNYLKKTGQKKSVGLLKIMNRIASRIEVLNETTIVEKFFDSDKIYLSNGMYAGSDSPLLLPKNPKKIVFAGHLYAAKGVYLLLRIIETCPDNKYEFVIYGERVSDSDSEINKCIEKISSYANVSFMNHTNDMSRAYSDASVVLSLQTISNYPSQVVMEGLAHGAAAIISKNGDSERFGDGPGIFYVPSEFDQFEYWQEISNAAEFSSANFISISESTLKKFGARKYVNDFVANMGVEVDASDVRH